MIIQLKRCGGARRDRTDDLLNANQALSQLSYGPGILISGHIGKCAASHACADMLVGQGGLEPPTSPLSGVRSNQLSYRPGSKLQTYDGAQWAPWDGLRAVSDPRNPADGNASSNQAICVSAKRR